MPLSTKFALRERPLGIESVHELGAFRFESGEVLSNLRIACVSYGELSQRRDNVLLILPGTSHTRHSALGYIGPGLAFDTDHFHVVCVDSIGEGGSSQPADGLRGAFPKYGIRDLVRAQVELINLGLGLGGMPLAAVAGASMGAFQALEWAIHYPEAVRAAVLVVPSAQAGGVMRTVTRQMIEIIKLDPEWRGGDYLAKPLEGLSAAGRHYYPWTLTDEYLEICDPVVLAEEVEGAGRRFSQFDPWNLIRRYQASSQHDVALPFGASRTLALARVRARILVLPCRQDRLLGLESAKLIAQLVKHAAYAEIDSYKGHLAWRPVAGSQESQFVTQQIRSFLLPKSFAASAQ